MILVIDNHDSFVHNIARYLTILGAETSVIRSDALTIEDITASRPEAIVISPGPCTPTEAGVSCEAIDVLTGRIPILGVCLGHQCIGTTFGGRVVRAVSPMHGLASDITHDGARLFAGLANPLPVGRYHSLIVEPGPEMDSVLIVDAMSEDGEIMALSHRTHPTFGVQFHPESILTPSGFSLFRNFLNLSRSWTENTAVHALV